MIRKHLNVFRFFHPVGVRALIQISIATRLRLINILIMLLAGVNLLLLFNMEAQHYQKLMLVKRASTQKNFTFITLFLGGEKPTAQSNDLCDETCLICYFAFLLLFTVFQKATFLFFKSCIKFCNFSSVLKVYGKGDRKKLSNP